SFDTGKRLHERLGAAGAAAAFDRSPLYGPGTGATIAPDGEVFNAFYSRVDGRETALFGEAALLLAPQWKLTVGGRLFRTRVDETSTQVGFSTHPGEPVVTRSSTRENGFTPKVSLAWTPGDRVMVYALAS